MLKFLFGVLTGVVILGVWAAISNKLDERREKREGRRRAINERINTVHERIDEVRGDISKLTTSIELLNAREDCIPMFVDAAIQCHEAAFHAKPAPKKVKK